ncbi:Jip3p [Saccharomyces cerevisiae]|uniref:Jip3p n=1 Tax=Saccharomyces cerevisiae (strain Lalvin EC1118 / Prise de mousse) TaxID=643680 RepID=C8ZDU2_YEAS8
MEKDEEDEESEEADEELLVLESDEKLNDVNDMEAMLVDELVCDTRDLLDVDEVREDESALEEETILDDKMELEELTLLTEERAVDTAEEFEDDDCTKNCARIVDMHDSIKSNKRKLFLVVKDNIL